MMTALRYLVGVVRYWCRAFNIWGLTIKVFLKKNLNINFNTFHVLQSHVILCSIVRQLDYY